MRKLNVMFRFFRQFYIVEKFGLTVFSTSAKIRRRRELFSLIFLKIYFNIIPITVFLTCKSFAFCEMVLVDENEN